MGRGGVRRTRDPKFSPGSRAVLLFFCWSLAPRTRPAHCRCRVVMLGWAGPPHPLEPESFFWPQTHPPQVPSPRGSRGGEQSPGSRGHGKAAHRAGARIPSLISRSAGGRPSSIKLGALRGSGVLSSLPRMVSRTGHHGATEGSVLTPAPYGEPASALSSGRTHGG